MPPQSAWELIQEHLKQPEYLHVLLNPLPIYGLAMGLLALVVAMSLRNRKAEITALIIVFIAALSAWPTIHYGEAGDDRAQTLNETSTDWLDAHAQRGERAEPAFYILAALAAAALAVPWKFPKTATALNTLTLLGTIAVLAIGAWVAYAGGQVRHQEFRYGTPPEPKGGYEKMRD